MIKHFTNPDESLERFRMRFLTTSVPLVVIVCLAVHICAPNTSIAEVLIVIVLLLGQIFMVICLESRSLFLFSMMLCCLSLKIASAGVQIHSASSGMGDTVMYFNEGQNLAEASSTFLGVFDLHSIWGTYFIISVTACLFKLIGSSFLIATILFTLISYWGQYLYYLAHCEVFPRADSRIAAAGLLFWPSIVFWSSFLGKDALMLFFLGVASFGMAKLSKRKTMRRYLILAVGVCGCALIRPHIAILLIISIVASFGLSGGASTASKVPRRALVMLLLSFISLLGVYVMAQLVQISNITEGYDKLEMSSQSNEMGGSGFDPGANPATRVILAPLLLVRPFPWEAKSISALLVSAEGVALIALAYGRRKNLIASLKAPESNGFVIYLLWFVALNLFLLGLGSSNYGLLARERIMILPLVLFPILAACPSESKRPLPIRTVP